MRRENILGKGKVSKKGITLGIVSSGLALSLLFISISAVAKSENRMKKLQAEIEYLLQELEVIKNTERGVLGELRRLESERKLREVELQRISMEIEETKKKIEEGEHEIAEHKRKIGELKRHLSKALKRVNMLGRLRHYRVLLLAQNASETLSFFKYASYMTTKDARSIRNFRNYVKTLHESTRELDGKRMILTEQKDALEKKKQMLLRGESARRVLLESIRNRKEIHREAINELRSACDELEKLINSFGSARQEDLRLSLNARKFKGLFAWPCRGYVNVPFGRIKHTKFGTELPHNGIDIVAPLGSDVRAVFDGKIIFAEWFKGYGLTIIIDHGAGILSVYCHASAILVEVGEYVEKGFLIGKIGDSASLKGPYLYFEIRDNGSAIDPMKWLSER
ncbi:MAG: peptidoglycan DD-metalloendopeptidase family protein [Acidobacteriota bacterium]